MRLVYYIVGVWCIVGCTAQTPKPKQMKTPLSDKEIKELGYQIKKEDTVFMNDNAFDIAKLERIGSTNSSGTPPYYKYRAIINENISIAISGDSEDGYSKKIINKKDFFEHIYIYKPSGRIKQYDIIYPNFFKKGIWYWYDEAGNIENYEDHDAPYTFTWEDVLLFLEKKNIKKEEITEIYRSDFSGVCSWSIFYKPEELLKTDNVKVLILDAKTGKIIDEKIANKERYLD